MPARPGILLDVSRLVSRIGQGPLTGIDRVEAAWLAHIAARDHLLLCRVSGGQMLLGPEAGPRILRWAGGDLSDLPARVGWRDRLRGQSGPAARARAALARDALAISGRNPARLRRHYLQHLPKGSAYMNVGHSNLTRRLLAGLSGLRRVVMIHDTIPLDHPEYTRKGQTEAFRSRLISALSLSEVIVAISAATASDVELWRKRLGVTRKPQILTAPIGTRLVPPDDAAIPPGLDLTRPFFVTLGTIEPRKNHALLLDAWEELARCLPAGRIPQLFIIGRRGWENHQTFARLDALPAGRPVTELAGLGDGAVAALVTRSHGLLMPSRAEGFGLPLTEAAGRGVPVLCTPLRAARELLGDHARYLSPDRPQDWAEAVSLLAAQPPVRMKNLAIPSWEGHFDIVDVAISHQPDSGRVV